MKRVSSVNLKFCFSIINQSKYFLQMSKKFLTLSFYFLWFCVVSSSAQNYSTIVGHTGHSFAARFGPDSVFKYCKLELDTVLPDRVLFHDFLSVEDVPGFSSVVFPWAITDTSWYGYQMMKLNNGDEVYLNQELDSIFFKSNVQLNDSWRMYTYSNGDFIQATLASVSLGDVLGTADSIRSISLQVMDSVNQPISSSINSKTFSISKNFGFTQLLSLQYFPNDLNYYSLKGVENPAMGRYEMGVKEIFNFDVGDVFHYKISAPNLSGIMSHFEKRHVIDKQVYFGGDSIVYIFLDSTLMRMDYHNDPIPLLEWYINFDTLMIHNGLLDPNWRPNYSYSKQLNKLPYQAIDFWSLNIPYHDTIALQKKSILYNGRIQKEVHRVCKQYSPEYIECSPMLSRCEYLGELYVEGLGFVDKLNNISYCGSACCHDYLVYYKKGTEVWGSPIQFLLILGQEDLSRYSGISIGPNPVQDVIRIKNTSLEDLELYFMDGLGRQLKSVQSFSLQNASLDISDFSEGVYYIQVKTKNSIQVIKLLKQ